MTHDLIIQHLGLRPYQDVMSAMQHFTSRRDATTVDRLWLVEHPPVFTQGRNGKAEHILSDSDIPIVETDRGGQITYHGPGQLVMYCLIDLRRRQLGVRHLVSALEQSVIRLLAEYEIQASTREDAPGVYVGNDKIAALGLRIRTGASYHGLSLNCDMDLAPFSYIRPCGLQGVGVTQLADLGVGATIEQITQQLCAQFCAQLGYNAPLHQQCETTELDEL
jgi:lipoyl(octanoyl) transferase